MGGGGQRIKLPSVLSSGFSIRLYLRLHCFGSQNDYRSVKAARVFVKKLANSEIKPPRVRM